MKSQKQDEQSSGNGNSSLIVSEPENSTVGKSTKQAFFITPLGSDDSDIRRATDGLIDAVIEPVLRRFDINLVPPHKIKNPGNITRQVVRHILESDLVIANLTGLNANVMYELAIRHAKRKPVIVIAEDGTKLPFDIAAERTIFYQNDMGGVVDLIARLEETIPAALDDKSPDNPIYIGVESSIIQEQIKADDNPVQAYLIEKIDQLSDSIAYIRNILPDQNTSSFGSSTMQDKLNMYTVSFTEPINNSQVTDFQRKLRTFIRSADSMVFKESKEKNKYISVRFKSPVDIKFDEAEALTSYLKRQGYAVESVSRIPIS